MEQEAKASDRNVVQEVLASDEITMGLMDEEKTLMEQLTAQDDDDLKDEDRMPAEKMEEIAPSGARVHVHGISIDVFEGGKIVDHSYARFRPRRLS